MNLWHPLTVKTRQGFGLVVHKARASADKHVGFESVFVSLEHLFESVRVDDGAAPVVFDDVHKQMIAPSQHGENHELGRYVREVKGLVGTADEVRQNGNGIFGALPALSEG